jgi:hypothetical protein
VVDYLFGNHRRFAGEVSREIRYYSIVEGAGQFCNPAQSMRVKVIHDNNGLKGNV